MRRWLTNSLEGLEAHIYRAALVCTLLGVLGVIVLYAPLLGVLLLVFLVYKGLDTNTPGNAHGTARWAGYRDLRNAGCLLREGCLKLGRMAGKTTIPFSQLLYATFFFAPWRSREIYALSGSSSNHSAESRLFLPDPGPPHLAVFGASGSGKTTSFVIPNLLEDLFASVILDPKGELFKLTSQVRARRLGHKVIAIDPFGIATGGNIPAARFNPLSLYRGSPDTLVDEARRLANALVIRTGEEKEPFFNDAAQVLIQCGIAFLMAEARPEDANLNRLRDILTNPKLMDQMLTHMAGSNACGGLLQRLAGQVRYYQGQTGASIFSVANTHLEFLDSLPVAQTLSETSFDPTELIDRRVSIYLCLPVDRVQELKGLQRILLTSLLNMVFQAGESRSRRIRFYLDEAATLGEIDALYNALVYGRSFGIRLLFLFQAVSQIEICFPKSKAADFKGTVASVHCGVADLQTAQEVSQWIGQTTVHAFSEQSSFNWGRSRTDSPHDSSQGSNYGGSNSSTSSESGRALIQPEEVLQLPKSAAIALLPNVRPILIEKVPYYLRTTARLSGVIRLFTSMAMATYVLMFMAALLAFCIGPDDPVVQTVLAFIRTLIDKSYLSN